jgi:cation transport ATPase
MLAIGLILQLRDVRPLLSKLFLLLATVAGGWYVSRRALQALRHRQLEMNTLMATACDLPEKELLRLAAALESRSEHPLAGAVLDFRTVDAVFGAR